MISSSQDGQVQADVPAVSGAESGNSRGLVRPFSAGESVVAAVVAVVLWALMFLGLGALGLGRGLSGLLATAGVIAVAYGMLRRSLGKVSCAVHFVTGLSEANTWKQWGELMAAHATLVPYTLETQATDEAGCQALRILRIASRLQLDKTTAWTDAETSRLVDELGYTPRLPLSEAFLPPNSLTDEQNETLGRLQSKIDRGDTAGFSELMPSLHELLRAYEEPVDRNSYDVALVAAHVHVLLGTKEDLDQASAVLRRMKHVFVKMHPQEEIALLLRLASALMRLSVVAPEYDVVFRAGQHLDSAEKVAMRHDRGVLLCSVYVEQCRYFVSRPVLDEGIGFGEEHLTRAVDYGKRAVALTGSKAWSETDAAAAVEIEANYVLGLAYKDLSSHVDRNSDAELRKSVLHLERAVTVSDADSPDHWEKLGALGLSQVKLARVEPGLDGIGRKNLLAALEAGSSLPKSAQSIPVLLSICRAAGGVFHSRGDHATALLFFNWLIDLTDQDQVRSNVAKLAVNRITLDVAEFCAYLNCIDSNYQRAIEILERQRTYFFRDSALSTEDITSRIGRIIQSGVTPVYLVVTQEGSYALVLRNVPGESGFDYDIQPVPIRDFTTRDIFLDAFLNSEDFLADYDKRWKMLKSLTPLLQPIAEILHSNRLGRIVILASGMIAQHSLGCVPIEIKSQVKWMAEAFTVSFLPALSAIKVRDNEVRQEAGTVLIVGSSAPDLPLSRFACESVSNLLKDSGLVSGCKVYPDGNISREDFLSQLVDSDVLHFDGHGRLDLGDPLSSTLELSNGRSVSGRDLQRHAARASANLSLAVLSACDSATTDISLLRDEGASLALGFLSFAGCVATVGTMWPVGEKAALVIFRMFYKKLIECGSVSKTATALRLTQTELRNLTVGALHSKIESWPGMADVLGEDVMNYLEYESPDAKPLRFLNVDQSAALVVVGIPELLKED